jgi:hypothetical protein
MTTNGGRMLDVLNFIFQDAWHFVGVVVMIYVVSEGLGAIIPGSTCTCKDEADGGKK